MRKWLLSLLAMLGAGRLSAQTPALSLPAALAYDAAGNLYIADAGRQQVFEATLGGQWIVVAGSGVQGFGGDGGAATAAQLSEPQGVAVGSDGAIYIADTANHRVRVVRGGMISAFAGTGTAGSSGDGGLATAATLRGPKGLAVTAAGDLLVCDTANHKLRRVRGGVMTTVAGTGVQGFSGDGGAAVAAQLDTPESVSVAAEGSILVADTHNDRVRVISAAGVIATLAGNGTVGFAGDGSAATRASLYLPRGVAVDGGGNVFIGDSDNQRIRKLGSSGVITTAAGSGVQGMTADGAPAVTASLNLPRGVAVSSFNEAVFADTGSHTVRVIGGDGGLYEPAALVPGRKSVVTATMAGTAVYGATAIDVDVSGSVAVPLGEVELWEGSTSLGQTTLQTGAGTIALATLAAGDHVLRAQYAGDGLNPAADSPSVAVTVARAASVVTQAGFGTVSVGAALTLTATVLSAMTGVPTGSVTFLDGGTQVATAPLANGVAQAMYASPSAGSHTMTASYGGDANFFASLSPPTTAIVVTAPATDFSLAPSGASSQSVVGGSVATYTLAVGAVGGAFNGAVAFGVTGLPTGATASFAPPQLVPGANGATTVLHIQTAAVVVQTKRSNAWYGILLPLVLMISMRKGRAKILLEGTAAAVLLLAVSGCGDRTAAETAQAITPQTFTLIVTGAGTSATGALLNHSTTLTLTVH